MVLGEESGLRVYIFDEILIVFVFGLGDNEMLLDCCLKLLDTCMNYCKFIFIFFMLWNKMLIVCL